MTSETIDIQQSFAVIHSGNIFDRGPGEVEFFQPHGKPCELGSDGCPPPLCYQIGSKKKTLSTARTQFAFSGQRSQSVHYLLRAFRN
ncbi:hypothetical protein RB2943 [Rhodopirellula baltica SH 1]|uniref:Uncharacterized protein n=1 Tax=Rhodopirellula baltica (strain DSM 10527 / NCIMB 13988 / SH1) TaxID=243090 RepID=Q7UV13_RHOBA|nr:hypothetical protein RB2943 [Rhodopirellula baltica SH 1]